MPLHKDLTGAELHEPKGVETALSGQVYIADGNGSGSWTTLVYPPVLVGPLTSGGGLVEIPSDTTISDAIQIILNAIDPSEDEV